MKILVIGSAEQAAECQEKFGPAGQYVLCSSWMEAKPMLGETEVVFDFLGADSPPEQTPDIFVDTSRTTLAGWRKRHGVTHSRTFGFCGLPTFVRREILEAVVPAEDSLSDLERICQRLGTSFEVVGDQAGLVTPRVICMIINEAYLTLAEGTATRQDIDLAMKLGTNYPLGPFEWGERIGLANVVDVLRAAYEETRDERYRICPLLIEQARLA